MNFKNPYLLLLILPVVFSLLRSIQIKKFPFLQKKDPRLSVPWNRIWNPTKGMKSISPRLLHAIGFTIAGIFLVIAFARPQSSFQKIKKSVEGIDIMLVLDLSASMRVEDFRDSNRFDVAKKVIEEFIAGRANDRIGLQTFSGEAVTLVPPTLDYTLLTQSLRNTEIGNLKDGTAIGDALATAVGRMKESTAKSKVIILVTDGDSNVGQVDPMTAGELAKGFGIKVYSIAIGREGRVAMPFVNNDIFGRKMKTYQYFDSSINPELLQGISKATNGKFYRVQEDIKAFREVFAEIDQLEKTKVETQEQVRHEEHFFVFLKLGILILVCTFILQYTYLRVYP